MLERHALFARRGGVRNGELGGESNRIGIAILARRCRGAEKALGELSTRGCRGTGAAVEAGGWRVPLTWEWLGGKKEQRLRFRRHSSGVPRPTSVQTVPGDHHERPSFSSVWRDRRGIEAFFANANPSMSKFTVRQRSFATSLVQIPRQDWRRRCRRVSKRVFAVGLPPCRARHRRCGREEGYKDGRESGQKEG